MCEYSCFYFIFSLLFLVAVNLLFQRRAGTIPLLSLYWIASVTSEIKLERKQRADPHI